MKRIQVYRSSRRRSEYRRMLLEKRAEVLSNLGVKFDTLASMGRLAEEDQAQVSHDEFISLHLNSLDYEQLLLVNDALARLDSGEYGTCQGCQEPIPGKRLQAIPWARYCIRCQNELSMGPPDILETISAA